MQIHILQHVDFEDEAYIKAWVNHNGYKLSRTLLFKGEKLPDIENIDLLVIMGGPMNIYEENKYPFLVPEKIFIEKAIAKNKKILGICLGAQLLAGVLGGKVTANKEKEIGWFNVEILEDAKNMKLFKNFPHEFSAFHWHGDTFDIPPGAVHIAGSEACRNQAFVYNERVAGLQFHLESTMENVKRLIKNCGDEIIEKKYIQNSEKMLSSKQNFNKINELMKTLLDNMAALPIE